MGSGSSRADKKKVEQVESITGPPTLVALVGWPVLRSVLEGVYDDHCALSTLRPVAKSLLPIVFQALLRYTPVLEVQSVCLTPTHSATHYTRHTTHDTRHHRRTYLRGIAFDNPSAYLMGLRIQSGWFQPPKLKPPADSLVLEPAMLPSLAAQRKAAAVSAFSLCPMNGLPDADWPPFSGYARRQSYFSNSSSLAGSTST